MRGAMTKMMFIYIYLFIQDSFLHCVIRLGERGKVMWGNIYTRDTRVQDPAFIISSSFCQIGTDNTEAGRLHYFMRRIGIKIHGMLLCWCPPPVARRRDTSIKDVLASTVCPDCSREDGPSLVSTWHRHSGVAFITPSLETFCCTGHRVLLLLVASHDWSGSPCQEI